MRHIIERQYFLEVEEVREALCDYLKKIDKPFPKDNARLMIKWNGDGEATLNYYEQIT